MNYRRLIEIAKHRANGLSIPEIAAMTLTPEAKVRRWTKTEAYRIVEEETLRELTRQHLAKPAPEPKTEPVPVPIPTKPKPSGLRRERNKRPKRSR